MGAEMSIIDGLSLIALGVVFPIGVLYALSLVWPRPYERQPMQREERPGRTGSLESVYGVPIGRRLDSGYSRNPKDSIREF